MLLENILLKDSQTLRMHLEQSPVQTEAEHKMES